MELIDSRVLSYHPDDMEPIAFDDLRNHVAFVVDSDGVRHAQVTLDFKPGKCPKWIGVD